MTAWPDWIDRPIEVGDLLADGVLGANRGEVLVCDSTTVNLFKLAAAALARKPGALVTDADNFPTDRYVLEGLGERRGLRAADPIDGPTADDVAARVRRARTSRSSASRTSRIARARSPTFARSPTPHTTPAHSSSGT